MKKCKIKSVEYIGKRKTYNLSMKSKQHNYAIYDENVDKSVITANSHAAAYGFISYLCCYLKANYTDEFVCSLLSVESERAHHDKIKDFERNFERKLDICFLPRTINECKTSYIIERKKDLSSNIIKTEIRPSLLCKGVGMSAAKNIEDNQPYINLRDFTSRTDFSIVDTRVADGLAEAGYFGQKLIKNKSKVVADFAQIRRDIKLTAKKGVESVDIFGI